MFLPECRARLLEQVLEHLLVPGINSLAAGLWGVSREELG